MKLTKATLSVVAIAIAMASAPAFAGPKKKPHAGKKPPLVKHVLKGKKLPLPGPLKK